MVFPHRCRLRQETGGKEGCKEGRNEREKEEWDGQREGIPVGRMEEGGAEGM